jgi:archaellum component FlaC
MNPELFEILKIILSSVSGGLMVKIVDWLANRGKNKADEIKTLQDFWHAEFERLEGEVKDLRKELNGKELDIELITTKYRELQKDYRDVQELLRLRDKKICDQDGIIEKLSNRIKELEELMRKSGIDPDKGKGD